MATVPWFIPHYIITRDLLIKAVQLETGLYFRNYSLRLSLHPNRFATDLMSQPITPGRPKRHAPYVPLRSFFLAYTNVNTFAYCMSTYRLQTKGIIKKYSK